MGAAFLDLAVLHDDDFVGVADGAQSVGNDHHGLLAAADQFVQRLLYKMLALGVQGRGRLVQ